MYKEGQKSPAQKEREAHLLEELLELIDERDKLERTKMTTERKQVTLIWFISSFVWMVVTSPHENSTFSRGCLTILQMYTTLFSHTHTHMHVHVTCFLTLGKGYLFLGICSSKSLFKCLSLSILIIYMCEGPNIVHSPFLITQFTILELDCEVWLPSLICRLEARFISGFFSLCLKVGSNVNCN